MTESHGVSHVTKRDAVPRYGSSDDLVLASFVSSLPAGSEIFSSGLDSTTLTR